MSFWLNIKNKKKIIGLSPMDGVTDAPFRKIIQNISNPDVILTEFVNVEGLARGAVKMLDDFVYSEEERPIIAQIYGIEEESFYKVAMIACYLGFDGIDINMGCPAKKVEQRGAGAGLINTPCHAKKIIQSVKKAINDFSQGKSLIESEVRPKVIQAIEIMYEKYSYMRPSCRKIPLSVKTRTGYKEEQLREWIKTLSEENLDAITLHGRTLKQYYKGNASWDHIYKAGELVKQYSPSTVFLGNGDITSYDDALEKCNNNYVDGALVGRAVFGNPWFFENNIEVTEKMKKDIMIHHCKMFEYIFPQKKFFIMRKHLGWYIKGFVESKKLRNLLMQANSSEDVKKILNNFNLNL
jgi:tRNA-dihydrouridine synthase B